MAESSSWSVITAVTVETMSGRVVRRIRAVDREGFSIAHREFVSERKR